MKPDAGAFAAAKRDVLTPWVQPTTKVFKGSFGRGGSSVKRFTFPITLDGALKIKLQGPSRSNYNLVLSSDAGSATARTNSSTSRDSFNLKAACREQATEKLTVAVKRVKGKGPFTLRAQYAG
jgi:hypothetical protein